MFTENHQVISAAKRLPEMKSMPRADFIDWLERNPKMYWPWQKYAIEAIKKKRTRFSAYMIRERVRWYTNIEYHGQYKISNNVTPYMSRLLAIDLPVLEGIFARKEVSRDHFDNYYTDQEDFFSGPAH